MVLGIDTSEPFNLTGQDLEQRLLGALFGNDPAIMPLINSALPFINNFLGLTSNAGHRSALLDMTLMSNMTPYGIYRSNMNNAANRLAGTALTRQTNAARRQWLENLDRTKMSFESWQQTESGQVYVNASQEEQQRAYDNYIKNEALGQMNNPLWMMAYSQLDPDGINAANQYLQQAGANQIRFGALKGTRTALLQARAIGNLFMENGKFTYNKEDYGFMNVGEASAIAAALTKDKDYFQSINNEPMTADKMEAAANKLKERVQAFTKAMGPLKDVFGSDIPAMIQAVEDLSGKRLASLDPTRISNIVENVMANTTVGGYNIGQLVGMQQQVTGALGRMQVPFTNELGALSQASTILNATETGLTPAFMSDMRYRQNTANWVLRTSNSSGAGYLNAAAAIWLDNNKGKTLADFEEAYRQAREVDKMSATDALMRLGGVNSLYELTNKGMQSANFQYATESDIGGRIARGENLNQLIRRGWLKSDNRDAFLRGIEAVKKNAELLSSTEALENSDLDEETKKQIRWMRAGMGMGKTGEAFVTAMTAYAEDERKRPMVERQAQMQRAANALKDIWVPERMMELVNGILSGKDLGQIFTSSEELKAIDPEYQEYIKSAGRASADYYASTMFGKKSWDELSADQKEKAKANIQKDLTYAHMNGLSNQMYQDALTGYEKATTQEEKIEYATRMAIASSVNETQLTDFVGTDGSGWGTGDEALTAVWKGALSNKKNTKEEAANEVTDYMNYKSIEKAMQDQGLDITEGKTQQFLAKLEEARTEKDKETGKDTFMNIDKAKSALESVGFAENSADADKLLNIINQIYGKDSSTESIMEDLVGSIESLVGKITGLTDNLNSAAEEYKSKGLRINLNLF